MFRRLRPFVIVGLAVIAYLAVTATPGSGHPATNGVEPHWSCKASAGYVNGFGGPSPLHLEALVANGDATTGVDGAQCQKDGSGFPQPTPLSFGSPQSGQVVEDAPYAYTTINNDFTYKQKAEGHTGVDHVLLQGNGHSLEATVVRADATAACTNGVPTPTTTSKVAGVSVDGTPTPVNDSGAQQVISNQPGFTAVVNEKTVQSTDGGKTYVQRAIHVQLGDTSQGVEIVIAEAKVGYHGDATQLCTPPPARCPAGATYDQSRGVCIVTVTTQAECPAGSARDAASGACIAVVGPPSAAPGAGGNVVPLGDVRGIRSTSPCKNKRFGRQVGIVGTNRGDRITGSNRSDRIFVFGGNDRVSGGRGNDCIEGGLGSDQLDGSNGSDWLLGGAGNDQLSGGQRNDVIYGGAGNDKLIGGTGNDKLYSGKGRNKLDGGKGNDLLVGGPDRDYITGGNGRDVIRAGRGNDDINVATAGPPAKVDCGPGVDTVRINNNELRTLKHCERVLVTTRLSRLKSYNKSYQNHKK